MNARVYVVSGPLSAHSSPNLWGIPRADKGPDKRYTRAMICLQTITF